MTDYPVNMKTHPEVAAFFDAATNTISYVIKDPASDACAIIDSVMDIDYAAARITYDHADALIAYVQSRSLTLEWIIETHVHADHLSAAPAKTGRQDRHRIKDHGGAGHLWQSVQRRHRISA